MTDADTTEDPDPLAPWDLEADAQSLPDDDADPALLLWLARRTWRFLLGRFGAPDDIAADAHITGERRQRLLDWLQPLERLVALILHRLALRLIASGDIAPPPSQQERRAGRPDLDSDAAPADSPSAQPAPARPRRTTFSARLWSTSSADAIDPTAPDAEARINAWYEQRRKRAEARRRARENPTSDDPTTRLWPVAPIARRLQALLDVLLDPMPAARRLARWYLRTGGRDLGPSPRHRRLSPCPSAIDRAIAALRESLARFRTGPTAQPQPG